MPVVRKPYFWIECDGEGCESRVPSPVWSDITALPFQEDAHYYAYGAEWIDYFQFWYCPDCQQDPVDDFAKKAVEIANRSE